jgi:hypothetical protein
MKRREDRNGGDIINEETYDSNKMDPDFVNY